LINHGRLKKFPWKFPQNAKKKKKKGRFQWVTLTPPVLRNQVRVFLKPDAVAYNFSNGPELSFASVNITKPKKNVL